MNKIEFTCLIALILICAAEISQGAFVFIIPLFSAAILLLGKYIE